MVSLLESIGFALSTHIVHEYRSLVTVGDDPAPTDSIDPFVAINAVAHPPPRIKLFVDLAALAGKRIENKPVIALEAPI